jgi:hypothetical protein
MTHTHQGRYDRFAAIGMTVIKVISKFKFLKKVTSRDSNFYLQDENLISLTNSSKLLHEYQQTNQSREFIRF